MLVYLTVVVGVITAVAAPALRAEAVDPTRPPLQNPRPAPLAQPTIDLRDYQVTSILISEHRTVAVINNQVVTVGDTVSVAVTGAEGGRVTVSAINAAEVTLRKARHEFVVSLPSSQYIKSELPASQAGQSQGTQ